jgi:mycothiol maleylpyruvate isomerase-like protein/SCP-2 sterol transfer family protein
MTDTLTQIRAAARDVVPDLVALLRSVPNADTVAVGTWTIGDVAAHLSHCLRVDTDAIAGKPLPDAVVTRSGIAEATANLLAEDGERDPAALADRISALATEFDDVASRSTSATVDWLEGTRLAPSAVAGHLLNELLVHGRDIADAVGRPWPIRRHHALLALDEGAFPLVAALSSTAFVNQEKAGSFRARVELRPRGGRRTVMVFDHGSLTLEAGGARDVDARVSVEAEAFLLLALGRQGMGKPILSGKLVAWGRRPWKLLRVLTVLGLP